MPSPDLFNLLKKVWHKHGFSSTVTRQALSLGTQDTVTGWYGKSYASSNVEMYIITRATRFTVLKHGLFFEYDGQGYTKDTVAEGDIIQEANGSQWLILAVHDRNILDQFRYFEVDIRALPAATRSVSWTKWDGADGPFNRIVRAIEKNAAGSSLKNLYRLSLGAQDAMTGWFTASYTFYSQITCPILDTTASPDYKNVGIYTAYLHEGYTLDDVAEGDVVKDFNGEYHRIREVKTINLGDGLCYYQLALEFLDPMIMSAYGLS